VFHLARKKRARGEWKKKRESEQARKSLFICEDRPISTREFSERTERREDQKIRVFWGSLRKKRKKGGT